MRVAVTGGSGFIGQATVKEAERRNYNAWAFDRRDGNDVLGDLSGLRDADVVIHLAGVLGTHELFYDPEDAVEQNVIGSLRIMMWCVDNGAAYVGVTMPDAFPSIYTATKIATQRLATALHHSRKLKVSHVRAFNAYGPGQKHGPGHPQKIIPTFATKAWNNEPIPIWGDGEQTVDLVHVDEIARFLVTATHYTHNETFDAGTAKALKVNEVAEFVLKVTGSKAGVEHFPMRDGETPTTVVATGEGWGLLGYAPWYEEFSWDRLQETVESYKP